MRKKAAYILLIILSVSLLALICGCADGNAVTVKYYIDGELYKTQNVETPSRFNLIESPGNQSGRVFNGWYYVKTNIKMKGNIDSRRVENNVTEVEAKWLYKDINISYNFEGVNSNPKTCNVDSEFELQPVKKHGYTFRYWRNESGWIVDGIYKPEYGADVVLYPEFTLNTYKIEYNLYGGTLDAKIEEYTVEDANFLPYAPTKDGYYFLGWSSKGNYNLIDEIDVSKGGNITLHAKWQNGTKGLIFEDNGNNTYSVSGCTSQTENIVIPDTYMGCPVVSVRENVFSKREITSVDIGANVRSIGNDAFEGCKSLSEVKLKNGLTTIGSKAFENCGALESIEFPPSLLFIGDSAFRLTGLTEIKFSGESSLESINWYAFAGTKIKSFFLPKYVHFLADSIFYGCALDEFKFHPEYNTEHFNFNAFNNMSLKKLTLPPSVKRISGFSQFQIDELDLSECVGIKVIENNTFSNSKIKSIILPPNLETIGERCFYRSSVQNVVVPRSVRVIEASAFAASDITRIEFEEGSNLKQIQNEAFINSSLTAIVLPSSLTVLGYNVFYSCLNLTSITFEAGSKLEMIGADCFANTPITDFDMPSGVKYCGYNIFSGCNRLSSVKLSLLGMSADSAATGLTYLGIGQSVKNVYIGNGVTRININTFAGYGGLKVFIPINVTVIEQDAFISKQFEIFAESSSPPAGWYAQIAEHAAINYNSTAEDMENA